MRIQCPNCKTVYRVKMPPAGVKVKPPTCLKCGTTIPIAKPGPAPPKIPVAKPPRDETIALNNGNQDRKKQRPTAAIPTPSERFDLLDSIGAGGTAEVFLARDKQLQRKVAVKKIKQDTPDPIVLDAFFREAQITAQLDHPNIVPLYSVKPPKTKNENFSLVMKLIKGRTLSEIIEAGRGQAAVKRQSRRDSELSLNTRLEYFIKACEGISYAHKKHVVHRDLKPSNIMIGDYGEVYVMDWGVAKLIPEADGEITITGAREFIGGAGSSGQPVDDAPKVIVGTPRYMSPEQTSFDSNVDQRSDVFSMGAILYELVTLGPARSGDTAEKLQWAVKGHLNLIKHALTGRKVAPELKAIIQKATELAPQDRYPDIMALAEDVRRYLKSEEVSVYTDNLSRRIWRKMSRYREASVITILSILLILSTIAAVSIWRKAEAEQLARHREQLLTTLQASVSEQGYAIDSYFSRLENLAASLARTAVYLIEQAPPNTAPVYFISDFLSPERAPADYRFSPLYDKQVSTRCPVARLAPGIEKAAVAPMVQRLAPMGYFYRQMFIDSRKATGGPPATDVEKLLRETGVPVRWAYIGLQSGVMFSFPGKSTYTDDFDPRKRPWYALGADSREVRWSNPYIDVQGQGPVLACATALYGRQDRFLGVLGLDVTFRDIVDTKMHRAGSRGVIESYLLNGKGQIVVRTKPQQLDAAVREKADTLPLTPFPVAALTKAITQSNAGLMEAVKDGSDLILVFSRLPSLGWFYVESIDANVLLGD